MRIHVPILHQSHRVYGEYFFTDKKLLGEIRIRLGGAKRIDILFPSALWRRLRSYYRTAQRLAVVAFRRQCVLRIPRQRMVRAVVPVNDYPDKGIRHECYQRRRRSRRYVRAVALRWMHGGILLCFSFEHIRTKPRRLGIVVQEFRADGNGRRDVGRDARPADGNLPYG